MEKSPIAFLQVMQKALIRYHFASADTFLHDTDLTFSIGPIVSAM